MLSVNQIRENHQAVLAGLQKRNFSNAQAILAQVLEVDDLRKSSQAQRDQLQAESNTISKEVGILMKEGKIEEATQIRERTAQIKSQIKEL
jgi:seryl-tRNA synthetase